MTAAEQWIARRRDHEGRGLRLHHSDYDRALDALEKVLKWHRPETIMAITGDCATEDCEHEEIDDCLIREFTFCAGCHELAERIDYYYSERDIGVTAWPCAEVVAIKSALGIKTGDDS